MKTKTRTFIALIEHFAVSSILTTKHPDGTVVYKVTLAEPFKFSFAGGVAAVTFMSIKTAHDYIEREGWIDGKTENAEV